MAERMFTILEVHLVFKAYAKGWEDCKRAEESLKELAEFDLDT